MGGFKYNMRFFINLLEISAGDHALALLSYRPTRDASIARKFPAGGRFASLRWALLYLDLYTLLYLDIH